MAAFASLLSCSSPLLPSLSHSARGPVWPFSISFSVAAKSKNAKFRCLRTWVYASDSSAALEFSSGDEKNSRSKKSVLFNLIRDIEPLDVSLVQKDVSPTTIDAMKRIISGMLGLLPSDQFQVMIEALWGPIFKLLISSMMTGYAYFSTIFHQMQFAESKEYTLRNAEYRLTLERNLEIYVGNNDNLKTNNSKTEVHGEQLNDKVMGETFNEESITDGVGEPMSKIPEIGEMTPEARKYIMELQSHLFFLRKELREVKRKSAALQMQQFVGEEKNDLLDYLRSLLPETVAELSEPTSPELKDIIHSVLHGLLATLSPKMHSKGADPGDNSTKGTPSTETEGDSVDLVENTSLQFQPLILLPRDYLARLLFWCMLLGHYIRGLEYRLELMDLLSLPCSAESGHPYGEQLD